MTIELLRAVLLLPLNHSAAWWTNTCPVYEGGWAIVLSHSQTQTDVLGRSTRAGKTRDESQASHEVKALPIGICRLKLGLKR